MTSITRRVRTIALAAGVFGTLGFGAAAAIAAPPAQADPFFCGVRASQEACKKCCLDSGHDDGGRWNPENGNCWCANPD
jgi:hypothetical protein